MEILRVLIESLKEKKVKDVLVGAFITYVETDRIGLASTVKTRHSCPEDAGRLKKKKLKELARLSLSENTIASSIGVAAINSGIEINYKKIKEIKAQDIILRKGEGKRFGLIGHFPFIEDIRMRFKKLYVFELEPQKGDYGSDKIPEYLPSCDIVGITGMTLINHTFEDVIKYVGKNAYVIMLGPSTPISEILFDYRIDAVCGSIVYDKESFISYAKEGACFKDIKGIKFVSMMRSDYD